MDADDHQTTPTDKKGVVNSKIKKDRFKRIGNQFNCTDDTICKVKCTGGKFVDI
jgi:hypothetical protein